MNHSLYKKLGNTDISLFRFGFGAGHIGSPHAEEALIERLLHFLLDEGVNFIDSARGYGLSEERIGKFISHRREDFYLSTKVGYGIPGYRDWTYDCILAGVEQALRLMRTDYIDLCFLHSCPLSTLQEGECTYALLRCRDEGKIRFAGYSGENDELSYAINSGAFSVVQTSYNLFEQYHRNSLLPQAYHNGIGVIAKRPLANVPWRFSEYPTNEYCAPYWKRMREMGLDLTPDELKDCAVRFSAYNHHVSAAIFGTGSIVNIDQLLNIFRKGPLPEQTEKEIAEIFISNVSDKSGQI